MQRKSGKKEVLVDGKRFKIAIVVSRFNQDVCGNMLRGALETLEKNGVLEKNIRTVWVPGAFEIPLACQKLAKMDKYDGLIALGCVIKGETDHYYFVAGEASRGIMETMLDHGTPIGFGIITTDNLKQAVARSSGRHNKGSETAQAVLETIQAIK